MLWFNECDIFNRTLNFIGDRIFSKPQYGSRGDCNARPSEEPQPPAFLNHRSKRKLQQSLDDTHISISQEVRLESCAKHRTTQISYIY